MSVGVLPFHPRLDSGGDRYAEAVDPRLLYPPGDLEALARGIQWFGVLGRDEWSALRRRARTAMSAHLGEGYRAKFSEFLRRISTLPPAEKRPLPKRPFPTDWLSFAMTKRLAQWRRRWSRSS
jgi:hypothetical protein